MKRKLHVIAILFMVILAAASCGKEEIPDPITADDAEQVEYKITSTGTLANLDAFVKQNLADEQGYYSLIMAVDGVKKMMDRNFPVKDKPLKTICYTYKSVDPQGNPSVESAFMAFPEQAAAGKAAEGIILYNHASITSDAECPTNTTILETVLAWMNYVLVVPDQHGFGASSSAPQAYLNPDVAAQGAIDAYKAAVQILVDLGVSCGKKVWNAGYSQGGFNAMANERYVARHPDCGVKFERTFAGGGCYDVPGTYESFLSGSYRNANVFALASIISFNESEKLGIPYPSLLKEPVLSNYRDWFLSKEMTSSQITAQIRLKGISDLLADDIIAKKGDAFDAIWKVCNRFSLAKGDWTPSASSRISIYHSTEDDIVPYSNHEAIKAHFSKIGYSGAQVEFKDLQDVAIPEEARFILKMMGMAKITHERGALYFVYDVITNGLG